jgi:hypothetical protein
MSDDEYEMAALRKSSRYQTSSAAATARIKTLEDSEESGGIAKIRSFASARKPLTISH